MIDGVMGERGLCEASPLRRVHGACDHCVGCGKEMATILVVDDEPMMLRLCANMLMQGNHEVLQARGGQEALDVLQKGPVDLALLDVIMPEMNGIELAAHILRKYPATKILLMTGFGPREVATIAGKENPYRILWKPFKAESLLQMIENVLGESDCASE
jgi:DNA-binding NtrC family response regulator